MAQMFPSSIRPDTESPAEHKLYEAFRASLADSYRVFHSVAWQARSGRYGARDGEADFVIVHPQQGILVVEVKGGQIRYDGPSGRWLQNNRDMGKDPFEQAKRSLYHLKRTLEEQAYWKNRVLTYAHAVAFPDVVVPDYPLTLQAPRALIFDKRDLQNVTRWVENVFAHYRGAARSEAIGDSGIRYLIEMLAPIRELRSLMGLEIEDEASEIVRLTEEQFRLLDFIAGQPRAAIAGCAGSGKTMLAAEKARRLAAQGWRVLLTCFNVNLAAFLKHDYLADRPSSLHIDNFHKVALDLVRRSGQVGRPYDASETEQRRYFAQALPDQLAAAVDRLGPQYDAIVVDEAQDFLENWWLPLQLLLEEPDEGTFYLFYDDNQNIYGGLRQVKNLAQSFPLTHNCRNTQKIHKTVQQFYRADHPLRTLGPLGRDVEIHTYPEPAAMLKAIRLALHKLIVEEEVDPGDIVVLTPRRPERSQLTQAGRLGNFRLTTNWDIGYDEIFYTTVHAFKGLESPVVILVELGGEGMEPTDELLYVGCSRACHHLIVICEDSVASRFAEMR